MGAPTGRCDLSAGFPRLTVSLAPGQHPISVPVLSAVEIEGSGPEATIIQGQVHLASGAALSAVTVTGGGLTLAGDGVAVRNVWVVDNPGTGVSVQGRGATISGALIARNGGLGLDCRDTGATLESSTVAHNQAGGLSWIWERGIAVKNSIIWANRGAALAGDAPIAVDHSTIEGGWPEGTGNLATDPLFCGWPVPGAYVDAAADPGGNGSAARPFQGLREALTTPIARYRLSLHQASPCLGAGTGGQDMGAPLGVCSDRFPRWLVHVARGSYEAAGLSIGELRDMEITGAGPGETMLSGVRLAASSTLSRMTLDALAVEQASAAVLEQVDVLGPATCGDQSEPLFTDCLLRGELAVTGNSRSVLRRCTATKIRKSVPASLTVLDSIVWGESLPVIVGTFRVTVEGSCVRGGWAGTGNIAADPRFCGWTGPLALEAQSDAELAVHLGRRDVDFGLAAGSPCLTSGPGGTRLGASFTGTCDEPRLRVVALAPGTYGLPAETPLAGVHLRGSSQKETVLTGALPLFGEGCRLEDLTVRNATVRIAPGAAHTSIRRVTVAEASGDGIACGAGSQPHLEEVLVALSAGAGIRCEEGAAPAIVHATVLQSGGAGIEAGPGARPLIRSSIVWESNGPTLFLASGAEPQVEYSALETPEVWPGAGNLNAYPRFCGFARGPAAVASLEEVQTTNEVFRPGLAADSPSRGAAHDGGDMGAPAPGCDAAGMPRLVFLLAPGTHAAAPGPLIVTRPVEIRGSGPDRSEISGDIPWLQTGTTLADVRVRGQVAVQPGASPALRGCEVFSAQDGIVCLAESAPLVDGCTISAAWSGVVCRDGSQPVVRDSRLVGCSATGLVAYSGSSATLERCLLAANLQGITLWGSAVVLKDSEVSRNRQGGVYLGNNASLEVMDSNLIENSSAVSGEGRARLLRCLVAGGQIGFSGGSQGLSLDLDRCTVADIRGGGFVPFGLQRVSVQNSVIWTNINLAIDSFPFPPPTATVEHSCFPGGSISGTGNIGGDPRFCMWPGAGEIHVDARSTAGDGSAAAPYPDLESALQVGSHYGLAADSPCRGAGAGGIDMGAPRGGCSQPGPAAALIRLAPGRYPVLAADLSRRASIRGAGAEASVIEGSLIGLREGAFLEDLAVTRGRRGGVAVESYSPRQGPRGTVRIERVRIEGNAGPALSQNGEATRVIANCLLVANSGGSGINSWDGLVHTTVVLGPGDPPDLQGSGSNSLFFDPLRLDPRDAARDPLFLAPARYDFTRFETTHLGLVPDFIVEPGDYRLFSGSPARDAGTANGEAAGDLDLARQPRIACEAPDLGAYEMQDCVSLPGPLVNVAPRVGSVPFLVTFAGTVAASVPGGPWRLEWDFGDGQGAPGEAAQHIYERPGLHYPRLLVANAGGIRVAIPAGELVARGDVSPWSAADLGESEFSSLSYFDGGCLVVASATAAPGGHVVHRALFGDGLIEARLSDLVSTSDGTAGLFLAEDRELTGAFIALKVGAGYQVSLTSRACSDCSTTSQTVAPGSANAQHLQLAREGSTVSGVWSSAAGVPMGGFRWPFPSEAFARHRTLHAGVLVSGTGAWPRTSVRFCDLRFEGPPEPPPGRDFRRGEASGDGVVNITDALFTLNHLFLGGPAPACPAAADANGDLNVNITDPVALLLYLFRGGPAPPVPFPDCGPDPNPGILPCEGGSGCGAGG
jgi:hypothetical protein